MLRGQAGPLGASWHGHHGGEVPERVLPISSTTELRREPRRRTAPRRASTEVIVVPEGTPRTQTATAEPPRLLQRLVDGFRCLRGAPAHSGPPDTRQHARVVSDHPRQTGICGGWPHATACGRHVQSADGAGNETPWRDNSYQLLPLLLVVTTSVGMAEVDTPRRFTFGTGGSSSRIPLESIKRWRSPLCGAWRTGRLEVSP